MSQTKVMGRLTRIVSKSMHSNQTMGPLTPIVNQQITAKQKAQKLLMREMAHSIARFQKISRHVKNSSTTVRAKAKLIRYR